MLASEVVEHIFSFLDAPDLCACFATCKHWKSSRDNKSTQQPIWFKLHEQLIDNTRWQSSHISEGFDWRQKVVDLHTFLQSSQPFQLTDNETYVSSSSTRGDASARLVSRSGHTANRFFLQDEEVIVLFGGSSHFCRFINSYDIFSVQDNMPIKSCEKISGPDVPEPRWLHKSCSNEDCTQAIVYGGQLNDGSLSSEVFMITLETEPGYFKIQGINRRNVTLKSTFIPPPPGGTPRLNMPTLTTLTSLTHPPLIPTKPPSLPLFTHFLHIL